MLGLGREIGLSCLLRSRDIVMSISVEQRLRVWIVGRVWCGSSTAQPAPSLTFREGGFGPVPFREQLAWESWLTARRQNAVYRAPAAPSYLFSTFVVNLWDSAGMVIPSLQLRKLRHRDMDSPHAPGIWSARIREREVGEGRSQGPGYL